MNELDIFSAALELQSPEERARCLDEACGDNRDLRRRIDELLGSHAHAGSFMNAPAQDRVPHATADEPIRERPGTVIGPYKLLQEIGEGGMGTVYMAEQTHPVQRKVALKVVKPGMDSRQVVARFEAERQALALMDHPNIARVLDAGTTEAGRPYFVMELVKGVPITKYCDEHRLTLEQRLDLLISVCHAVQHAHQKGIIHRDLKPSNVLVAEYDVEPVAKVIDFGVAKASGSRLTDRTMFTEFGQIVGTLEYMSPEQAKLNALDIDTRSDIYALGVLLYELLTGTTPFENKRLRDVAFDERLRIIREEEPQTPSNRLSTTAELPCIAANRNCEPKKLSGLMRGELDWIVMKCLEKDRNRRYETAAGFAADVQRYLNDEPVLACPPTTGYRLRKFARRHAAAVLATSAILVALTAVLGTAAWWVTDRAARQTETARAVNTVLQEADRYQRERKIPQALAQAKQAESILLSGASTPVLVQRVHDRLADLELVAGLEQRRGFRHHEMAQDDAAFAQAFRSIGIDVDTLSPEEAAGRIRERSVPVELAAALDTWSSAHRKPRGGDAEVKWMRRRLTAQLADPDPLRNRLRQIVIEGNDPQKLKALLTETPAEELSPATVLAFVDAMDQKSDLGDTVHLLQQAVRRYPDDYWLNVEFAFHVRFYRPTEHDEPLRFYSIAAALRPNDTLSRYMVGALLLDKGLLEKNKHLLEKAIGELRECLRLQPDFAEVHERLANALGQLGRHAEAEAAYRTATEVRPNDGSAHLDLGTALLEQGRHAEAEVAVRRAIDIFATAASRPDRKPGGSTGSSGRLQDLLRQNVSEFPYLALAYGKLGEVLSGQGRYGEALAAFRTCHELGSKNPQEKYPWTYPSAQQVRAAERLVELEVKLAAVLSGDAKPANNEERLVFAQMCVLHKRLNAEAVRFFGDAFAAAPKLADDIQVGHRYNAACAAALAGCGQGNDAAKLDDAERARIRRQALDWLTADLAVWAKLAENAAERPKVLEKMQHWQTDPDFAGVRDAAALAKLPEAEHADWQKLWADVAELRKRTEDTTNAGTQPKD